MRSPRRLAALSLCALVLAGCGEAKPEVEGAEKSATVVTIPGSDRVRVRVTPDAVKRLDLQIGTVQDLPVATRSTAVATPPAAAAPVPPEADATPAKGKKAAPVTTPPTTAPPPPPPGAIVRRVIPFKAVLYAPSGEAFTYVSIEPELFERTPIVVEYVAGDVAVLTDGPPRAPLPGTPVVTVGGPELSGAEFGVGE